MKLPRISVLALIVSGTGVLALPAPDAQDRRKDLANGNCVKEMAACYVGIPDPPLNCCKGLFCESNGTELGVCRPFSKSKRANDIQEMQPRNTLENTAVKSSCTDIGGYCPMGNECCSGGYCEISVGMCYKNWKKRAEMCEDRYCIDDASCPCPGWFCESKGGFCRQRGGPLLQKVETEPMSKLEPQALELGNDIQDTRAASKREAMPEQMGDGPFDQPTIGGGDGPTDNWCIARAMSCGAAPSRCCKGLKCETAGEPDGFTWMECKPA